MIINNELRDRAYNCACEHGFHDETLSNEHCLMLVITELSEAVEADRKDKHANIKQFEIDKLIEPESLMNELSFIRSFEKNIKDSVEDELADAVIRLLDLAGVRKIDCSNRFILQFIVSKKRSFIENIYKISKELIYYRYTLEEQVNYVIRQIFQLAEMMDIDLLWHIEQKMKYNELREYKHGGKKY